MSGFNFKDRSIAEDLKEFAIARRARPEGVRTPDPTRIDKLVFVVQEEIAAAEIDPEDMENAVLYSGIAKAYFLVESDVDDQFTFLRALDRNNEHIEHRLVNPSTQSVIAAGEVIWGGKWQKPYVGMLGDCT